MSTGESAHVLIVDDEAKLRRVLAGEIEDFGYRVTQAGDGEEALEVLRREAVDLCLLDLRMPGMDGLEVLRRLKGMQPLTEVLMLTGHGSVEAAIDAMKIGAWDFVTKPCPLDVLEMSLAKALEKKRVTEVALGFSRLTPGLGPIYLGESEAMQEAMAMLKKAAVTEVPILITGESGTGKEMFAREAHRLSPFAEGPFMAVNCGALQPSLVESTLFGHEKGAFTGADRRKLGLVEVADGGSLFLDEIGELPPEIQVKLLRFTQFGEFQRVGGSETLRVQTRLLAATNVDLAAAIEKGAFRADLFYRLNTIAITIPPLRDRPADIVPLARCFLRDLVERGRAKISLGDEAESELRRYPWPGNVRELRSVMDRLSILADSAEVSGAEMRQMLPTLPSSDSWSGEILPIREMERRMILRALEVFDGDRGRAAAALEISVKTLYNKLKSYEPADQSG